MSQPVDQSMCTRCCEALAASREGSAWEKEIPPVLLSHLTKCPSCGAFARDLNAIAAVAVTEIPAQPPSDLIERTFQMMTAELTHSRTTERRLRRRINWQLGVAGLLSLPVILGLNGTLTYLVYLLLGDLSRGASAFVVYGFIALTLLGLSLLYGAMPLFSKLAVDFRRPQIAVGAGRSSNSSVRINDAE